MYLSWIVIIIVGYALYSWGYGRGREDGFNVCQSSHPENQFDWDRFDDEDDH